MAVKLRASNNGNRLILTIDKIKFWMIPVSNPHIGVAYVLRPMFDKDIQPAAKRKEQSDV